MEQSEIRGRVEIEIAKWADLNRLRERYATVTPKAMDFIVEVIENIVEDPLRNWKEQESDSSNSQQYAISLIPNALNDVVNHRRGRHFRSDNIEITTWEIWISLSEILKNWCFIPRDV